MESNGLDDRSLVIQLAKTTANVSCEFNPKFERYYRDLAQFIVDRQLDLLLVIENFMKIFVNLR